MNNPIIQRELIGMLRTRRAVVAQLLLVIILGGLVLLRWPADAQADLAGSRSQQVLSVFGYGLMVVIMLLTPVFAATSIVSEKQKGTLPLLLNSPMSPAAIFAGKWLGSIGYVLLLLLLSLPAAAACFSMGGIDAIDQIGRLYLVLFVVAITYATLGLLVSATAGSTESAVRLTYGVILALAILTLGPYQFLPAQVIGTPATIVDWLRCVSPIPAVRSILGDTGIGAHGLMQSGDPVLRFLILGILLSITCSIWTIVRLRRGMLDRPRAAGKITDDRSTSAKAFRRVMYLWFFDPQRRSGLIGPMTNPVMIKEQRTRRFGRGHWMMRMITACVIISMALMLAATNASINLGLPTLGGIMVLLQVALIILITPSLSAGIISSERESGGWQLLQMTPLSPWQIVRGKLYSVASTLSLLLIATLPGYVILLLIDSSQTVIVIPVLITLVFIAAFAILLSAAVSSLCKTTAVSAGIAYSLLVLLCAGTMLFWLGQNAPFAPATVQTVLTINPLAAALSLIQAPGFDNYQLVPANWWCMGIASALCLLVLVIQTYRLSQPR